MQTEEITTRQIYDLLLTFKEEANARLNRLEERSEKQEITMKQIGELLLAFKEETNVRFNKLENRMEKMEFHLDIVKDKVNSLEKSQKESKTVLDDLWSKREKVTVGFSTILTGINVFISACVAMFIALFTGKYVYRP